MGQTPECVFGRNAALSRRSDEDDEDGEDGEKEADEDVDQKSSSESNADADNADVIAMRNARKFSDRNQKIAATVEGTCRRCRRVPQ
jgi:hypothetical protein